MNPQTTLNVSSKLAMKKNNLPTALSLLLSVLSITTFTLLTLAISGACCAHDFKTCESIITASDLPLEMVLPDLNHHLLKHADKD